MSKRKPKAAPKALAKPMPVAIKLLKDYGTTWRVCVFRHGEKREYSCNSAAEAMLTLDALFPEPARFSIRKAGELWCVTTERGRYRHEHWCEDAREVNDLLDVLTWADTCHACCAPLWSVNGKAVCSRHLNHEQPEAVLSRYRMPRFRPYTPSVLPEVKQSKIRGPSAVLTPAKLATWCKSHLVTEQTETVTPDGRTHTFTRYTFRPPVKRKAKSKPRVAIAARRVEVKPVKPGEPWGKKAAVERGQTAPIRQLYASYVSDMKAHGITPRSFEMWEAHYTAAQRRLQCASRS